MKTGYKVGDCMTIRPVTVSKSISITECARIMRDKHVGSLIVEDGGKLHGLVTEQDLVRKGIAENKDCDRTSVDSVMVGMSDLLTITPEKDLYEALTLMRDYNIRHLPVMERGSMVGFLTIKDILKIQPQLFDIIVEKFEIREETRKPLLGGEGDDSICDECKTYSEDLMDVDGFMLCPNCRGESEEPVEEEEYSSGAD